jgi:acetylornithine/succinyldiaminopimelate/putrescine aminotransferase
MKITSYDFEKITHISSELSSIDQAKVNSFLENSDAEGVNNALKLIKTRLSDEDFELIKDIWLKVSEK